MRGAVQIGAGHGFGYNDMIVVEMAEFIRAIVQGTPAWPDFAAAVHVSTAAEDEDVTAGAAPDGVAAVAVAVVNLVIGLAIGSLVVGAAAAATCTTR